MTRRIRIRDADPKPFNTTLSFRVLSCLAVFSVGIDARYKVFYTSTGTIEFMFSFIFISVPVVSLHI